MLRKDTYPRKQKTWLLPQILFPKIKNNTEEEFVEPAPETSGFQNLESKNDSFGPCLVKIVERLDLFERDIKKKNQKNMSSNKK